MRAFALFAVAILAVPCFAQKPTLKPEDYKQWQTLVAPQISGDGHWLSYQINVVDGDGFLVIKNSDGPILAQVPVGSAARFTDDSKFVAFMVSPPRAITERLREEKKPIEPKLILRNLETGQETMLENVVEYGFTKDSKTLFAFRPSGRKPVTCWSSIWLLGNNSPWVTP